MLLGSRLLAATLVILPFSASLAQAPVNGRTVYDAGFFTAFAPSNALQVVQRVPGFSIELVNPEVRGFGQAAGNVVINGQRPSLKSEALDVVLARIPASRVARIEVGPGDQFGAEFAGKPQVVNLVLSSGGGLAGTASGTLRRSYTGAVFPFGDISLLARRGTSSFNVAAGLQNGMTTEEGSDHLLALPSERPLEYRRKVNTIHEPRGYVSASWAQDSGANRTAHLNGRVGLGRFNLTQANHVVPEGGTVRDDRLTQRYHRTEYELGGDITRPLLGGGIKLIGLATWRHRLNKDVALNQVQGDVRGGFAQDLEDQSNETLARLTWTRTDFGGWAVEAGGEAVLNSLDSQVDFYSVNTGGSRTRIDLPVDAVRVEEWRGEGFVNAGRPLAPTLRLDLGLTYEASRLTVSGDASALRRLDFVKPKASLDWHPKGGWRVQLAASRSVAQLQFEDFVSAAELSTDRVNGGNAELVPQRAWEAMLTTEHPILREGLIKLELGYNRVSKVQDRIPTPEGYDAPGNLGGGRQLIARGTLDAPLGSLGITGGRLNAYVSFVDTSVEDPYTLMQRRFSGNNPWVFETSFRQDLGRLAWGVSLEGSGRSTSFRRNEIDTVYSRAPVVSLFGEYRPDAGTTLTLGIDNLTDAPAFRQRRFFSPDRRTAQPDMIELRERNRHVLPYLSFKRNFG